MPADHQRFVLIVDDDQVMRETLAEALAEMGVAAECAADGLAALERLRAGERPCAVLLDMRMPRLDGEGLLAALRVDAALADIPVVTMTGLDAESAPEVHASLRKPFDMDELARILVSLCE
jgi:CheY-like chemotaxis protein